MSHLGLEGGESELGFWIEVNNRVNIGITEIAYAIKKNDWSLVVGEQILGSQLELSEVLVSHVIDVPAELNVLALLGYWHFFVFILAIFIVINEF